MHRALLLAHRYVGLAIAVFLVVAGLTGSVLVYYHELDAAINPQLLRVHEPEGAARLDPLVVRAMVADQLGGADIRAADLHSSPGEPLRFWLDDGGREVFADPFTGKVVGTRRWGDPAEGLVNLMPFIYRLHYQLALGETGTLLFGVVALLWTVDCVVGLLLTMPPSRAASAAADGRSWLVRWKPAWLVRATSLFGAIFTLHRAAGLWLWVLLLVFAWSAVGFNLRPVYSAAMGAVLPRHDAWAGLPRPGLPVAQPRLDYAAALATGRTLMEGEARRRGFAIGREGCLDYDPALGLYRYDVHSSLDLQGRWPGTRLWIDGDGGGAVAFDAPTGIRSGNTADAWLMALHMGGVGGHPYRLLVVVTGCAVALLSVSGIIIWWRKRRRTATPLTFQPDPSQPPPARAFPSMDT